ncbi:MAG: hypothetical protein LBP72_07190 [Dysgonamonadaceae bacterium]|nr:hypothetical protein [Dysgonamonadaceae bacterium]
MRLPAFEVHIVSVVVVVSATTPVDAATASQGEAPIVDVPLARSCVCVRIIPSTSNFRRNNFKFSLPHYHNKMNNEVGKYLLHHLLLRLFCWKKLVTTHSRTYRQYVYRHESGNSALILN